MMFLAAVISLFALSSSDRAYFVGCQSDLTGWWSDQPFLVAGVQQGRWEGWIGLAPAMEFYRTSADSNSGEGPTVRWWDAEVSTGVGWVERDTGLGQTLGLQTKWLEMDSYSSTWPSEYFQIEALWGVSYRANQMRVDIGAGPSFIWISNSTFAWRFDVQPTLDLRVSRSW